MAAPATATTEPAGTGAAALLPGRWRRWSWARPATVGGVVGLTTVVLAFADPTRHTLFPPCPLLTITGLDGPLCGGTRATYELAHGNLIAAADHNLWFAVLAPFLVAGWVAWMARSLGYGSPTCLERSLPWWAPLTLAVSLIAFGVIRNLPVEALLFLDSARM